MSVPYYLEYLSKVMDLAYNTAMKSAGVAGVGKSKRGAGGPTENREMVSGLKHEPSTASGEGLGGRAPTSKEVK
jgi:hypothetical protein